MSSLTARERAALRWAVGRADEWYGNVSGCKELEENHMRQIQLAYQALIKLGIVKTMPETYGS